MKLKQFLILLGLIISCSLRAKEDNIGEVTANRLLVRSQAGKQFETVSELRAGDKVVIKQMKGEWLGIEPTDEMSAWIKADTVGGLKTNKEAKVYAGPADAFKVLTKIPAKTSIKVLQKRGVKWLRIEAPADIIVWVNRNYIKLPKKYQKMLPEKKELADAKEPKKVAALKAAEAPEKYKIYFIEDEPENKEIRIVGIGRNTSKVGTIIPLNNKKIPWTHALAVDLNGTFYPLYYISAESKDVAKYTWHKVSLTGKQNWIEGWPRPMIHIKSIRLQK
ncbi:MAG: hypothetical protein HRT89_00775 [Lentisphaeria bacterium]|nr:hypothetical protein [Lentisphaeria bacterium]NQZ66576.1 hypothetical protein [Lentisphaeria bacterium]